MLPEPALHAVLAAIGPVTLWCAPDTGHRFFRALQRRHGLDLRAQPDLDLGRRMAQVFAEDRARPLLLIGADCPALNVKHLWQAAVELAFAMQTRFAADGLSHTRLTLVGGNPRPLAGFPFLLRHKAAKRLAAQGIAHLGRQRVVGLRPDHLLLENGSRIAADAALLATSAAAPTWPAASGLATDDAGFIRVDPLLQSVSHPGVFAAGDVAAYADPRPKSGVFAVRAGPPLAEYLRAVCQGQELKPWQPQRRALYLLSTGQKYALAAWGGFSSSGAWVWRWKDRIDRRFIAQFGA